MASRSSEVNFTKNYTLLYLFLTITAVITRAIFTFSDRAEPGRFLGLTICVLAVNNQRTIGDIWAMNWPTGHLQSVGQFIVQGCHCLLVVYDM